MKIRVVLPCVALAFSLGGCLSSVDGGPDRLYSVADQESALRQQLPIPDLRQQYDSQTRNDYITARMFAIDLAYNEYFSSLTKERQLGTLGADLTVIGLGAATSVIPGASTKAVLGAATAAIAGSKSAVDKDIFIQQTVQILQNQMEVSRDLVRQRIIANLRVSTTVYSLAQGLSDLEDYYRAGTLAGALEAVSASVGDTAQQHKAVQNGLTQDAMVQSASPLRAIALGRTEVGARLVPPKVN